MHRVIPKTVEQLVQALTPLETLNLLKTPKVISVVSVKFIVMLLRSVPLGTFYLGKLMMMRSRQ